MNDLRRGCSFRLTLVRTADEADGRKHRSQKSQARIVNAMLELVAQGNPEPSADQIADIAKVGRRSVFRHFNDMDTLYREMTDSIARSMGSIVLQPFQAADWEERILELVDRRAIVFEKMKPFLLAGQVHRHRSPFLKASHAQFVQTLRQILLGLFPKEIARNADLVDAFDMLPSFETWSRLREDPGLSTARSKHVLKQAIRTMLGDDELRPARQADSET